ncbi:hypothetical protein Ancab_023279 [Ancistrocladus abbreviatus]
MMTNSNNISCIFFLSCFLILSSCLKAASGHGHGSRKEKAGEAIAFFHSAKVTSLLPDEDSCMPSPKLVSGEKQWASLEVVHRYGPCSKHKLKKAQIPTHFEILQRDEARVKSIRSRIGLKSRSESEGPVESKATTLPAESGASIGSGNYIVTVGLGTPKEDLSLIFDTGSDFTWTQCQPCVRSSSCYQQVDPIFDPRQSSTYANISCSSAECSNDLASATSATPGCSGSTCVYGIQYGDSSYSVGFFATETLTLTSSDVLTNFLFGCGENNQGLFSGSAGLLGLGRNKLSVVSQAAAKYGKYFSYCLPSTTSSSGYLTFGKGSLDSVTMYTSLLTNSLAPSFYFVNLQEISVGGSKLQISPSVFSTAGTIIDSGTVITRLPPAAYSILRSAFREAMSNYPTAPALSILDTCYNFTGYTTISVPKISLYYSGAVMDLGIPGILYVRTTSQVCLAFAGNSDASDLGIIGNVQQRTFNIIYDVDGAKLGIGPGGCN